MKIKNSVLTFIAIAIFFCSCNSNSANGTKNSVLNDSTVVQNNTDNSAPAAGNFNYALGLMVASNLNTGLGITASTFNVDVFTSNVIGVLDGSKSSKEAKEAMMAFNQEAQKVAQAKQQNQPAPALSSNFVKNAGLNFGFSFKSAGIAASIFNTDDFKRGFFAGLGEGTPEMTPETANQILKMESDRLRAAAANRNLEAGQKFLAETVSKKAGIQKTASGMYYEVLKAGNGPKPAAVTDKVLTHYHGTLIDGSVFDSSVDRGEPIEFALNQVIKGWTEILQLMPKGSKWRVYIPSELAYGAQGSPGGIGPNETLIFEIELFKINGQ